MQIEKRLVMFESVEVLHGSRKRARRSLTRRGWHYLLFGAIASCRHAPSQAESIEASTPDRTLPAAPAPASSQGERAASAPAPVAAAAPAGPIAIDFGAKHAAQYFGPLAASESAPLVVMLHGMCALPEYECPAFRRGSTGVAGLLCPPGPVACRGGGAMWAGGDATLAAAIDASIAALRGRVPAISFGRRVLIGYSLGASAAARVVSSKRGQWSALMLVNAAPELHAKPLSDAGIERVALVAGARDRTAPKLRKMAARLARGGLECRFFSLADTGHYFDAQTEARLVEPLGWLLAEG
jgi:predicted esterase